MSTPSRSIRILRVIIAFVCIILGASVGVYLSALRITSQPQLFHSTAKVVAGGRMTPDAESHWRESDQDFYGTIIETIEWGEMHRKARDRVSALNPELKAADVKIRVVQSKGSAIFTITATGSEPKYTRIFLNALLDEFIAFRQSIYEQAQGKVLTTFLQETADKLKQTEAALVALEAAKLAAGNDTTSNSPAASALRIATEKHAMAKLAYEKMFERAKIFQAMFNNTYTAYVAVQERATTASEHVEDWQRPILIGGGIGALAGLLTGLLVSGLITALAASNSPPAASAG